MYWIYLFFYYSFWPGQMACRILVPRPQIEPRPQQWKGCILTTGLPRSSLSFLGFSISCLIMKAFQFSSVPSLSCVWLFVTLWIAARQASLSITNSRSSLRLMSLESVMPSSHLILCRPFLLLPPIPPSIRVFSSESTLRMRWPKYWSFSFNISPYNEHPELIS